MLTLGDNDGPVSENGQSVWQRLPQRTRPKAKGSQWESVQSSKHTYVPTCQRPVSESPSVRSTGPPSRFSSLPHSWTGRTLRPPHGPLHAVSSPPLLSCVTCLNFSLPLEAPHALALLTLSYPCTPRHTRLHPVFLCRLHIPEGENGVL